MARQSHHLHVHLSRKKRLTIFDQFITIAAVVNPLTGLPQILQVFNGHTDGISLSSWIGFMVFSVFFLVYGSIHKLKPLIVTNLLWLVIDGLIVIGTVANRM